MAELPEDVKITDEVTQAIQAAKGVATATDNGRDGALALRRGLATLLAARLGVPLVLMDRSKVSWTMTPNIKGPSDLATVRDLGIAYLAEQMEEALAAGVPDVLAAQPSLPSLQNITDVLKLVDVDVIVVPEKLRRPRLADRWQAHHDLPEQVLKRAPGCTVLLAHEDGRLTLVEDDEGPIY